jgi:hypothetical protein
MKHEKTIEIRWRDVDASRPLNQAERSAFERTR